MGVAGWWRVGPVGVAGWWGMGPVGVAGWWGVGPVGVAGWWGVGPGGAHTCQSRYFLHAGQFHSFCRILLTSAGQYCTTVLLGENLDTLKLILTK